VVGWFACPNNPESYAGWSLVLLVGPSMLERWKGRGLTKSDPLALRVEGLAQGQQLCPVKNNLLRKRQKKAALNVSGYNGQWMSEFNDKIVATALWGSLRAFL